MTTEIVKQRKTFPSKTDSDIESGLKACKETKSSQRNHHTCSDEEESNNPNVSVSDAGGDAAESGNINDDGSVVSTMRHNPFNRLDRSLVSLF
jgi:hypothetical protein